MTLLNTAQQIVRTGSLGGYVYARNQAAGWAPGPGQFSMQVGNARIPINKTDGEGTPFPQSNRDQVCSFYYGGTLVEEQPINACVDRDADTWELRFSSAWTQLLDGLTYQMRIDGAPVDPAPPQPQMAKKVHLGGTQVWPSATLDILRYIKGAYVDDATGARDNPGMIGFGANGLYARANYLDADGQDVRQFFTTSFTRHVLTWTADGQTESADMRAIDSNGRLVFHFDTPEALLIGERLVGIPVSTQVTILL